MVGGGGLGTGGFGSLTFGTGAGFCVSEVRQTARNAVDVTFDTPVLASDPSRVDDALNPRNWTLEAYDPFGSTIRLAQFVERLASNAVRVLFDGILDAFVTYRIVAADTISDAFGIPIDPSCQTALFSTFGTFVVRGVPAALEQRADLNNPQIGSTAPNQGLGTYQVNDRNDFALHGGPDYLRKRVIRRATTALTGFFHLPEYGFSEALKTRVTPDLLRRIQARAQSQLLQEPDVVSAAVSVRQLTSQPSIVILTLRVVDREGTTVDAEEQVDLTEPIA